MKKQNYSRQIVSGFLLLSSLTFIGDFSFARTTKKPAAIGSAKKMDKNPFENFIGRYQISSCQSSGQMTTEYCDYKYLIVSKVGVIGADGLPAEAVKFRYMTLQNAGAFLDNSVAFSRKEKDVTYVGGDDSAGYKHSVIDSSGHTVATEIHITKNTDGTYQLQNRSSDIPKEGEGFVGETALTLKKL